MEVVLVKQRRIRGEVRRLLTVDEWGDVFLDGRPIWTRHAHQGCTSRCTSGRTSRCTSSISVGRCGVPLVVTTASFSRP